MRRRKIVFIAVTLAGCLAGTATSHVDRADGRSSAPQQFRDAERVPADVTLYLHVSEAASIRRLLANRPMALWFDEAFAGGEAAAVWSQVAKSANLDEATLFDALLGRRLTFVLRRPLGDAGVDGDVSPSHSEWALLTEIASDGAEKALGSLKPVAHGPQSRMALLELPEHELLLARRGDLLLIGPRENKRLFMQMLRSIGGRERETEEMLAANAAIDRIGDLSRGPGVAIILRHGPPLGGHSVMVAAFHQGEAERPSEVSIRHYGSFDASPFTRGLTRRGVDCSILEAFDEGALLAVVEPNDAGRSALELFLHATVGETLLSPKMRQNLGERRVFVMGAQDAGNREREAEQSPVRCSLSPAASMAVCYEIMDAAGAQDDLDRQMLALARRLSGAQEEAAGGARQLTCAAITDRPRSADAPLLRQYFKNGSLNWVVVDGGAPAAGGWYVISSHADHLDAIVSALSRAGDEASKESAPPAGAASPDFDGSTARRLDDSSPVHSAGVVHGGGLAHLLRSAQDVPFLARDETKQAEVRESLRVLSDLMQGLERIRWRLARPSEKEIDLEVRIMLAE